MTIKKSVLIAASSTDALSALSQACDADDVTVVTATDGLQAMVLIARAPPDLAILDFDLPGADGASICEQMARDAQTAAVPVIVLSAPSSPDSGARRASIDAHHVVKDSQAVSNVRAIMCRELGIEPQAGSRDAETAVDSAPSITAPAKPKILIVDDDAHILEVFSIKLSIFGADVITAKNGSEALTVAAMETPDVIVSDYTMPGGSGEYFMHHLRSDPILKDVPVIVLTGRTFQGDEDVALKRNLVGRYGAVAFLAKPVDEDRFVAELRKHVSLLDP